MGAHRPRRSAEGGALSVAFRRDGDDEHKEPRFELPLPPGPNLVTARGLRLIEARVAALEGLPGDEQTARDLRYWRTRQATAEVVPVPPAGAAAIGSRVVFRLAGRERALDIVGHDEAEPAANRIAFSAPLAAALIGGEAGERVDFNGVEEAIDILAATPIPEASEIG